MNKLDQLKEMTSVVADTGDIEAIKLFLKMPQPTPLLFIKLHNYLSTNQSLLMQ